MIRECLMKGETDLCEVDAETHNNLSQNYKSGSSPGYQLLLYFIILYSLF